MKLFRGTFIHSLDLGELQILRDTLVGVDEKGSIVFIESSNQLDSLIQLYAIDPINVMQNTNHLHFQIITLGKYQIIIPGFVDTHIHAPQCIFFLSLF